MSHAYAIYIFFYSSFVTAADLLKKHPTTIDPDSKTSADPFGNQDLYPLAFGPRKKEIPRIILTTEPGEILHSLAFENENESARYSSNETYTMIPTISIQTPEPPSSRILMN